MIRNEIVRDCVNRFCLILLDNVVLRAKSDEERKKELEALGKHVGTGCIFNSNACLMDSLLQTMAEVGLVDISLKENSTHSLQRRRDACIAARMHLNTSDECMHLRPVLRAGNGEILRASDEEHGKAFLEHDRHAEALVRFFLHEFGVGVEVDGRGVKIIVYTRLDSLNNDPVELALVLGRSSDAVEDPFVLELYNVTGEATHGTHYEPVLQRPTQSRTRDNDGAPPPPVLSGAERPPKKKRLTIKTCQGGCGSSHVDSTAHANEERSVTDAVSLPSALQKDISGQSHFRMSVSTNSCDPRMKLELYLEELAS